MTHIVFSIGDWHAKITKQFYRFPGAVHDDEFVARTVLDQSGRELSRGLDEQALYQFLREPRTQRDESAKSLRFAQRKAVGHRPALAEAEDDKFLPVDRVARQNVVEKCLELLPGRKDGR